MVNFTIWIVFFDVSAAATCRVSVSWFSFCLLVMKAVDAKFTGNNLNGTNHVVSN